MGTDLVSNAEDLTNWQTQVNWTFTADENDLQVDWLAAYSVILPSKFSASEHRTIQYIKPQGSESH